MKIMKKEKKIDKIISNICEQHILCRTSMFEFEIFSTIFILIRCYITILSMKIP